MFNVKIKNTLKTLLIVIVFWATFFLETFAFAAWQVENYLTLGTNSYLSNSTDFAFDFLGKSSLNLNYSITKWTNQLGTMDEMDAYALGLSKDIDEFITADFNYLFFKVINLTNRTYGLGLNLKLTDLMGGEIAKFDREFSTNLDLYFSTGSTELSGKAYTEYSYALGFEQVLRHDTRLSLNYTKYSYPQEDEIKRLGLRAFNRWTSFATRLWNLRGGFPSFIWNVKLEHTFNRYVDTILFWSQAVQITTELNNSYTLEIDFYPRDFLKLSLSYTSLTTPLYPDVTSYYGFGLGRVF